MTIDKLIWLVLAGGLLLASQPAAAQYAGSYQSRYDRPTKQQRLAATQGRLGVERSQHKLTPTQATLIDAEVLAQSARVRSGIGANQFRATTVCDKDVNIASDPARPNQPAVVGNVTVLSVINCVGGRAAN